MTAEEVRVIVRSVTQFLILSRLASPAPWSARLYLRCHGSIPSWAPGSSPSAPPAYRTVLVDLLTDCTPGSRPCGRGSAARPRSARPPPTRSHSGRAPIQQERSPGGSVKCVPSQVGWSWNSRTVDGPR